MLGVEVLPVYKERWPDQATGPLEVSVTVAIVDGAPEAIGLEMWSVDRANLPESRFGGAVEANAVGIRTRDHVRRLPLQRMVGSAVEAARGHAEAVRSLKGVSGGYLPEVAAAVMNRQETQDRAGRVLEATEPKRAGRKPLPRSHYENVAGVYLAARRSGLDPIQAVMEHWFVSKSQAAKWVYRCRRDPLNLLPPTTRGVPAGVLNPTTAKTGAKRPGKGKK
jgi:hypothetical protein